VEYFNPFLFRNIAKFSFHEQLMACASCMPVWSLHAGIQFTNTIQRIKQSYVGFAGSSCTLSLYIISNSRLYLILLWLNIVHYLFTLYLDLSNPHATL
jgi:hypothetical protein